MPVASSIVGMALGEIGSYVQSGLAAMDAGDQKDAIQAQERQINAQATADSENIKERGRRVAASQEAALAGSGVTLDNQGSGSALLQETKRLTDKDVLATLTTAHNQVELLERQRSRLTKQQQQILVSNLLGITSSTSKNVQSVGNLINSTSASRTAQTINNGNESSKSTVPRYNLLSE